MKWFYQEDHYKQYLANDKGLSFIKGVAYMPDDPKMAADYKIMLSEVRNVTQNFMVDEGSAWRNYLDNEYRDAIKKAVNGEMTPKEALDSFAEALSQKSKWKLAK
jgi:alpha-1,4-digalacturonate transport system substrate-binding protein